MPDRSASRPRLTLAFAGGALVCVGGVPALAQSVSQPVVQAVPAANSLSLNAALARLGRNPRDVEALIDAGKAALGMGDVDAAVGFFQRADQLSPDNARIKAGLAGAMVRGENPFDAIALFDAAEHAGASDAQFFGDRGLAYDLLGDNATAQRYYRQALTKGGSEEIVRRLALSLAISGDKRGMETTLSPLLLRQDKAAWRIRAFGLAILGSADEAESIAYATMPKDLAAGISPYLRYMARLTPAQQAAAASFGHFPRAADIGRDDPRIAQYAVARPRATLAQADTPLVPAGQPLGRTTTRSRRDPRTTPIPTPTPAPAQVRAAATPPPPVPQPTREVTTGGVSVAPAASTPAAVSPTAPAAPIVTPPADRAVAVAPPVTAPVPATTVATAPALAVTDRATAGFTLPPSTPASSATLTPTPTPSAAPARPPAPARRPSLTEAFGDLLTAPPPSAAPAAGAVDIRRITPTRPAAPKVEKPAPPPPSHPSRIWVQVATGRDKAALGFDWRRIVREAPEATRGKKAYTSNWNQTNRLLTGPFETQAAANAFLTQLRRADVDGAFVWTSPAGQVVDTLAAR